MDIRELRYFAAVFQERNLTAAAKRCFISQPSISTAITSLEAELGTMLFIRHKKGVAPTASAEQFYGYARRIIDDADAARNLFRKPSTRHALTLGLMRTLDIPGIIALLKPLTSAPGVGQIVATAVVSVLDEARRFDTAHQVESYLGLVTEFDGHVEIVSIAIQITEAIDT